MHLNNLWKQALFTLPLLLLAIAGCSPHPGSGTWLPLSEGEGSFSKLMVHYNGRAELYSTEDQEIEWRCFWVGISESDISLDCAPSSNPEIEEHYRLNVVARGEAELLQNERVLGRFSWQQIEK